MLASSQLSSVGLTGGVYRGQGRIHQTLLKSDYYGFQFHEAELQASIQTKAEFRD